MKEVSIQNQPVYSKSILYEYYEKTKISFSSMISDFEIDSITGMDKNEDASYRFIIERVKYSKISIKEKKVLLNQIVFIKNSIEDEKEFEKYVKKLLMLLMLKEVNEKNKNCRRYGKNFSIYEAIMLEKYVKYLEEKYVQQNRQI